MTKERFLNNPNITKLRGVGLSALAAASLTLPYAKHTLADGSEPINGSSQTLIIPDITSRKINPRVIIDTNGNEKTLSHSIFIAGVIKDGPLPVEVFAESAPPVEEVPNLPQIFPDVKGAPDDNVWDSIAFCESTNDWSINTENGHFGGLQFDIPTWESVGGTGLPSDASREEQIYRAKLLWQDRGFQPWDCKPKVGLTIKSSSGTISIVLYEKPSQVSKLSARNRNHRSTKKTARS